MKDTTKPFDGPITKTGIKLERYIDRKDSFVKLVKPKLVAADIKEAKRVGYLIEKDDMSFYINDDETGELVMMGILVNRSFYACTLSKKYWQEPPIRVSAGDLERVDLSNEILDA